MRRHVAILPLLLLASSAVGQPNELTLSCSGLSQTGKSFEEITNSNGKERIINEGLVVNLAKKTVSVTGIVSTIYDADQGHISFHGKKDLAGLKDHSNNYEAKETITGILDRVTGRVDIYLYLPNYQDKPAMSKYLSLMCTPTKRIF